MTFTFNLFVVFNNIYFIWLTLQPFCSIESSGYSSCKTGTCIHKDTINVFNIFIFTKLIKQLKHLFKHIFKIFEKKMVNFNKSLQKSLVLENTLTINNLS